MNFGPSTRTHWKRFTIAYLGLGKAVWGEAHQSDEGRGALNLVRMDLVRMDLVKRETLNS
jgi:hypothetical protein